ncbi:MAG: hypothetical protein EPN38_09370 [Rhodanobacteraceae bacterium]|nr:MAG: hypothetical protein EPN38_09370 [Rhodanobacteraceae bacterium]
MKLTDTERYEIEALAFTHTTGYDAPGKDVAPAAHSHSYDARCAAWDVWMKANCQCIGAILHGVELTLEDVTDAT